MYCRNCGTQLPEGIRFCEQCGTAAGTPPQQPAHPGYAPAHHPEAKSRIAAALFGIFLGSLGVHRFYLGYIGTGIIQIILTFITFGFGGVWGFIEGIVIIAGGFKTDAKGIPLRD
jgi:TM2 domain-containing membrane protein YozV